MVVEFVMDVAIILYIHADIFYVDVVRLVLLTYKLVEPAKLAQSVNMGIVLLWHLERKSISNSIPF